MIGLVAFIDDHSEEVEYDLIHLGLRLRDWPNGGVSWRDLLVIVRQAPLDSAVYRAVSGDEWQRTPVIDFLRQIEHTSRVLAWQQGGGKSHDYPALVPLPWDEPLDAQPDAMSLEEVFEFMGWDMPKQLTT